MWVSSSVPNPLFRNPLRFGHDGPIQTEGFYQKPRDLGNEKNRFVVIGDSGGGLPFREMFADRLERLLQSKPFQSVLVLGDNVYGAPKDGTHPMDGDPALFTDRLWESFKGLIQKGVELFPILGNHDVRYGQEEKQLAYLNVPRYYQFSRGNVDFFAVDTTVMLPSYDSCYKERPDFAHQKAKEQVEWLDQQLAKSKSKYKIVMGHYPMYCSGRYHTRGINAELVRSILQPILIKHQVDAYLCGHEHHYERSQSIYGLTHFLSGSSSKLTKKVEHEKDPPYSRAALKQEHQFMLFEETDDGLAFQTINKEGQVIDSGLVPPRSRPAPVGTAVPEEARPLKKILSFLSYATKFLHKDPA